MLAAALWQPPDVSSSTMSITTTTIVAAIVSGRGAEAAQSVQGVETMRVVARDGTFDATARMRDGDYRVDVTLGDARYEFGRYNAERWRRTPSGSVRVIRGDVQGDALDRWPRSIFGTDLSACAAAGTSSIDAKRLWVLSCRQTGDPALFYYVDLTSGHVLREVSRDGSHVVIYDFDDFRSTGGWTQAFHWKISGAGGDADVTVTNVQPGPVADEEFSIPASVPEQFGLPSGGVSGIGILQDHLRVTGYPVRVDVDGQARTFLIDTGTSQIIVDIGEATRLGLHPAFGHAIVREFRVGDAVARNLPVQTVDLFGDAIDGLLGNEFFTGHIVHIDNANHRIELISHAAFTPPQGAAKVDIDTREGMPIVAAMVNGIRGERFVLDTGSPQVMLSSAFLERARLKLLPAIGSSDFTMHFLEGPLLARQEVVNAFSFGVWNLGALYADVEQADPDNLDVPIDGIIGRNILSQLDLWFDYDNGVLWAR